MEITPIFRQDLEPVPEFAGVHDIHRQLQASNTDGEAVYFPREDPGERGPDFLLGVTGQAHYLIYVSPFPHSAIKDESKGRDILMMHTDDDGQPVMSPLGGAAARAVGISKQVQHLLTRRVFIIPVDILTGDAPSQAVQAWSRANHVGILHRTNDLLARLGEVAQRHLRGGAVPPTRDEIARVMAHFKPGHENGVGVPEQEAAAGPDLELAANQVIIQHANTVNIYTTTATGDGPAGA